MRRASEYRNLSAGEHPLARTGASGGLPVGARNGRNDWKRTGYDGPCPPIGGHRYFYKLYALEWSCRTWGEPAKARLGAAMRGQVPAQAEIVGTYQKGG